MMYDDYYKLQQDFPVTVRKLRQDKGWKRKDLADAIGANINCVQRWETGKNLPSAYMCKRLAAAFGVTIEDIIGDWRIEAEREQRR